MLDLSLLSSCSEKQIRKTAEDLSDEHVQDLLYDWEGWLARPKQRTPSIDFATWFILAGRGFGKTRTGAEWIRGKVERGGARRIAFIAPTAADARDVMVEGESGILAVSPPRNMPLYEPSKRRLTWPDGAIATLYSAEEPDRLNGPQHDTAWSDEIGVWKYGRETWDMLQFGLRLGNTQQLITSTPKVQNISLIKEILAMDSTVLTTGTTYENRDNLSKTFFDNIVTRYEGTRLGRQELHAQILDDVPGALWTREILEANRVTKYPELIRIVVAIDPAVSNTETSSETGIVVAGLGKDRHGYVLEDLTLRGSPREWAAVAVEAYHRWEANRIVAEVNNGGDMVEAVIRSVDDRVAYKSVRASRGKRVRAEPVASYDEQGKIHHVGAFPVMEDQLCSWTPESDTSPDRLDARVWAFTFLMKLRDFSGLVKYKRRSGR